MLKAVGFFNIVTNKTSNSKGGEEEKNTKTAALAKFKNWS